MPNPDVLYMVDGSGGICTDQWKSFAGICTIIYWKHPEAVICGEVQQYQATEYSLSAYLKHVCLIVGSEQIPIKNLRVFLKSNKEFPIGTTVKISGKLEEIPEPRNPGEFDSRQFYACQKIYYFMKTVRFWHGAANIPDMVSLCRIWKVR